MLRKCFICNSAVSSPVSPPPPRVKRRGKQKKKGERKKTEENSSSSHLQSKNCAFKEDTFVGLSPSQKTLLKHLLSIDDGCAQKSIYDDIAELAMSEGKLVTFCDDCDKLANNVGNLELELEVDQVKLVENVKLAREAVIRSHSESQVQVGQVLSEDEDVFMEVLHEFQSFVADHDATGNLGNLGQPGESSSNDCVNRSQPQPPHHVEDEPIEADDNEGSTLNFDMDVNVEETITIVANLEIEESHAHAAGGESESDEGRNNESTPTNVSASVSITEEAGQSVVREPPAKKTRNQNSTEVEASSIPESRVGTGGRRVTRPTSKRMKIGKGIASSSQQNEQIPPEAIQEARANSDQLVTQHVGDIDNLRRGALQWCHLGAKLDIEEEPYQSFRLHGLEFMSSPYPTTPPEDSIYNSTDIHAQANSQPDGMTLNFVAMYQNMEQFWGKYGPNIRKLVLYGCRIYSMSAFGKVLFEELPNLEELALAKVVALSGAESMKEEKEAKKLQLNLKVLIVDELSPAVSWRSLFLHFPNIQSLGICSRTEYKRVVEGLKGLDRYYMEIKELDLEDVEAGGEALVEELVQLPHFQLEKFSVDFELCDIRLGHNLLQTVMQRYGSTIKELSIKLDPFRSVEYPDSILVRPRSYFPFRSDVSLHLEVLELGGPVSPNLHFLEQLPNLKRLDFELLELSMVDGTDWERIRKTARLPHLEYLRVGCYVSAEMIDTLATIMPNVERLTAQLDTCGFRVVCEKWRNLKILRLFSCFVKRNNESLKNAIGDEDLTGMVDGCNFPNIVDLKYLQEVYILTAGKISDASIWNGFLKLPNLRSLDVQLSGETSNEALKALKTRFPESASSIIRRPSFPPGLGRLQGRHSIPWSARMASVSEAETKGCNNQ